MKKVIYGLMATVLVTGLVFSLDVRAEDATDETDPFVSEVEAPKWNTAIQNTYTLTEQQMKTLNDSGLNPAQKAKIAGLAQMSGKSLEEVLKMRTEQKMSWGKMAQTLGVQPGEIGKSVAKFHQNVRQERQEQRQENRQQTRAEKHAKKVEKAQERRNERKTNRQIQSVGRSATRRRCTPIIISSPQ